MTHPSKPILGSVLNEKLLCFKVLYHMTFIYPRCLRQRRVANILTCFDLMLLLLRLRADIFKPSAVSYKS